MRKEALAPQAKTLSVQAFQKEYPLIEAGFQPAKALDYDSALHGNNRT